MEKEGNMFDVLKALRSEGHYNLEMDIPALKEIRVFWGVNYKILENGTIKVGKPYMWKKEIFRDGTESVSHGSSFKNKFEPKKYAKKSSTANSKSSEKNKKKIEVVNDGTKEL